MLQITPLFSGSSGNSVYVKCEKTELLIDAGVSFRSICRALSKIGTQIENISCVFVTHEHSDHIKGLETLCKKCRLPVYINSRSANYVASTGKYPFFSQCIKIFNPGTEIPVDSLAVRAFHTPHDSCGSVGYRIDCADGDSFSYATDMGYVTRDIARNVFGSKTVVFESNHDPAMLRSGAYPDYLKRRIASNYGHLSNAACADFVPYLAENGTKRIILAHLSKENNTVQKAYDSSTGALKHAGYGSISLEVAPQSIIEK